MPVEVSANILFVTDKPRVCRHPALGFSASSRLDREDPNSLPLRRMRCLCRSCRWSLRGPAGGHAAMTNRLPLDMPGMETEFGRVEVRRSSRRKKTVSAEIVGDALVLSVPDRLSRAEEHEWVRVMASRLAERRRRDRLNSDGALMRRAVELAERYVEGVRPSDIRWV